MPLLPDPNTLVHEPEAWIAVAWLFAVIILMRKALPPLLAALDMRSANIAAELAEAQQLREEAEALLASYAQKQKDALHEAEELAAHARSDAERLIQDAEANLVAMLARREAQAEDRIQHLQVEALKEIRAAAADVALAATREVLIKSIDVAKGNALIEQSIAGLPAAIATEKLGQTIVLH